MKFATVFVALAAASVAVAGPVSFEAREDSSSVELNDVDHAAINYLVARGLFSHLKSKHHKSSGHKSSGHKSSGHKSSGHKSSGHKSSGHKSESSELHVSFEDSSGSVSEGRKKEATKALKKAVSKEDRKKYPYCTVAFGDGGSAKFRCFSSSEKKIGQQGPAGAIKI